MSAHTKRSKLLKKLLFTALTLSITAVIIGLGVVYEWRTERNEMAFGNTRLSIEQVRTPEALAKGLGGRDNISEHQGMLFVFNRPDTYCFWMKDMKFPIDIVWLDGSKRVVYLEQNVSPDSYPTSFCPDKKANSVLEVQAGLSARSGVDVGAQL